MKRKKEPLGENDETAAEEPKAPVEAAEVEEQEEKPVEKPSKKAAEDDQLEDDAAQIKANMKAYLEKQLELTKMDLVDLNEDFVNQPGGYLRAAAKYAAAESLVAKEKIKLDQVKGEVDQELRASEAKTTEAFIEKAIKADARVVAQARRIVLAEYQLSMYQAAMRAWDHKRDMLIQVGAFQRAEFTAQVQVNKPKPSRPREDDDEDDDGPRPKGRARQL